MLNETKNDFNCWEEARNCKEKENDKTSEKLRRKRNMTTTSEETSPVHMYITSWKLAASKDQNLKHLQLKKTVRCQPFVFKLTYSTDKLFFRVLILGICSKWLPMRTAPNILGTNWNILLMCPWPLYPFLQDFLRSANLLVSPEVFL